MVTSKCRYCGNDVNMPDNWTPQRFEEFTPKYCSQRCYNLMRGADGTGYLERALHAKEILISDFARTIRSEYIKDANYRMILWWCKHGVSHKGTWIPSEAIIMKCGFAYYEFVQGSLELSPDHDFDYRLILRPGESLEWPYDEIGVNETAFAMLMQQLGFKTTKDWVGHLELMWERVSRLKVVEMSPEEQLYHTVFKRMKEVYEQYILPKNPTLYGESFFHKIGKSMWRTKSIMTPKLAHALSDLLSANGVNIDYRMMLPELTRKHYQSTAKKYEAKRIGV